MIGIILSEEEITEIFKLSDSDGNGITFHEFVSSFGSSSMSHLVSDIMDLQSAFLASDNVDPRDDISEVILKLRGSIPTLTDKQVRTLIKLHTYTFQNDAKLKPLTNGHLLTRKCISPADVSVFLSEKWGNPTLGGFFARKAATEKFGAREIILQLGLDYANSPYIVDGKPGGLVYLIEDDLNLDTGCLVPIDPRLRERIRAVSETAGDKLQEPSKYLYDHSYACAVADGSEAAKAAAISLEPPYVGVGFCVHGTNLESDSKHIKLVQELVAMVKDVDGGAKAQRIAYSVGSGIWAQGLRDQKYLVAVWDGKNWVPTFKVAQDIPSWLAALEGHSQDSLFQNWQTEIVAGHGK